MSTQQKPQSTLQKLSKRLNVSETELLIAIKQLGLNPSEVEESWGDAIAQHLTGNKPQQLHGKPPETPKTPESFSINDSEEFVEWEEVEEELGETALALVNELGLNQDAITQSDLAALRELALSNPVHQNLADHIGAVGSVQEGLTNEHIRVQFETGTAIGEAGNTALIMGMLQSQLNGLQQAYSLQTAINTDFQKILNAQLEQLGKTNKGTPDKTVQDLGKKATSNQQNSNKSSTVRNSKLDVIAIKNSLNK
ncbi:hypothetical protein [Planktothrix mougeotii]|uniref:Uncharacterized protein n=1 Tax=Planktothrix mougeotii LEGE 06226 TaxID=1828728 RepID=A0ABR9UIX0_9CYAN|nr:hypothetical protein [Planktothrix mougeotii]MBE9146410.1 hypothetical protein [Planktothrix mougeotii LEGE 06226]